MFRERERHININKFGGLSRDWVDGKNVFSCVCVCECVCVCVLGSFLVGERKTYKHKSPENPGTIPQEFGLFRKEPDMFYLCGPVLRAISSLRHRNPL